MQNDFLSSMWKWINLETQKRRKAEIQIPTPAAAKTVITRARSLEGLGYCEMIVTKTYNFAIQNFSYFSRLV